MAPVPPQIKIILALINVLVAFIKPLIIIGGVIAAMQLAGVDVVGMGMDALIDQINPFTIALETG